MNLGERREKGMEPKMGERREFNGGGERKDGDKERNGGGSQTEKTREVIKESSRREKGVR